MWKERLSVEHPLARRLFLGLLLSCALPFLGCRPGYEIVIATHNDALSCDGLTVFDNMLAGAIQAIDMDGTPVWEVARSESWAIADFEVLAGGDLLFMALEKLYRVHPPNQIVWERPVPRGHHCAIELPGGNIMYLFHYDQPVEGWALPFSADGIREISQDTGETVWEWRAGEHISTGDHCPVCIRDTSARLNHFAHDWLHSNALIFEEAEQAVYLNVRNLNRLVKIDYPSGDVIWSMGDDGEFGEGLWSHGHDPQLLANGNILIFDNGNHKEPVEYSRAVEIAFDPSAAWAEAVWEWSDTPPFYDCGMGDANRLPNGNTLITNAFGGRIIEVTGDGEVAWEMRLDGAGTQEISRIYKAERLVSKEVRP